MAPKPPQIVTQDNDESSDDHFSSASEGAIEEPRSPIPLTRVERVDDIPAYGEIPGTPSYAQRTADAVPDELEIVPDGQRSRSGTRSRAMSNISSTEAPTAGGPPIPKTVVERVDDKPAHGEVEGTAAHEKRLADAEPDEVKQVDDVKAPKVQ
ncbi:hypothetical protein AMS68_003480 [Peltaster fructicola]|uniref:Uncharacterized protein n=1 Tax=Peltaster fructicola TaxID=286661 RepID=A0A6H0XTB0_9PEZI|nr:hypothetical protein AMS68_003480 [Peltaster fructicola]